MKKILVVLLVLAVATGVFAQEGEWSLSGKTEIGTYVDLSQSPAPAWGWAYNKPYGGWDDIHAQLGIGYTKGDAKVGVAFNYGDGDAIDGNFTYNGENYRFTADTHLQNLVLTGYNIDRLWGDYKFLNGLVTLEVALKSQDFGDGNVYSSDRTGALAKWTAESSAAYTGWPKAQWGSNHAFNEQPWTKNQTFVNLYDKSQILWADVSLENLSFGVFVPNLFGAAPGAELIKDGLKQSVFGVKFTMQPVEVAAQFRFDNYGVYFGGKFNAGPITAGLSFSGILGTGAATKDMRFGGKVEFNPEAFSAWVSAFYGMESSTTTSAKATQIGIEPGFFYNVIPTHLQFRTDIGFYFAGGKDATGGKIATEIGWAVQPQLFWNFLGTGAGSYWGYGTGIIVRYRLLADAEGYMGKTNALDVNFKWSF